MALIYLSLVGKPLTGSTFLAADEVRSWRLSTKPRYNGKLYSTSLECQELEGNAMQVYFSHDMKFAHCTDHNARHWRTYSS